VYVGLQNVRTDCKKVSECSLHIFVSKSVKNGVHTLSVGSENTQQQKNKHSMKGLYPYTVLSYKKYCLFESFV
jgi:hypothetical protein